MKKSVLFSLIVVFAITTACQRESAIEPNQPTGVWSEQITVPVLHISGGDTIIVPELLIWDSIIAKHNRGIVNLDTLRLVIKEVEFAAASPSATSTMDITIRYLEGPENMCGIDENGVVIRKEVVRITYFFESSGTVGKLSVVNHEFLSIIGQDPDCSSDIFTGTYFEFTRPSETTMNLVQFGEDGMQNTIFLQRKN